MKAFIFQTVSVLCLVFLAACGGEGGNEAQTDAGITTDENVTIQAMNWHFDEEEYVVSSGDVTIELVNETGNHGIVIKEADSGEDLFINRPGSTVATLQPGEYIIECSIPCGSGHNDMVATLIVT